MYNLFKFPSTESGQPNTSASLTTETCGQITQPIVQNFVETEANNTSTEKTKENIGKKCLRLF